MGGTDLGRWTEGSEPFEKIAYRAIIDAIDREDLERLAYWSAEIDEFPGGRDMDLGEPWVRHAVVRRSSLVLEWMLNRGVDISSKNDGGLVFVAVDGGSKNRQEILRVLLAAGAPVNARGYHDYTPAHLAASRNDVESLKVLVEFGADLSLRTRIDGCTTPLEEAEARK